MVCSPDHIPSSPPPLLPPPKKKPLTLQSYSPTLGLTQNQPTKQNR